MEGKYIRLNPTTTHPHSREALSHSSEAKPKYFMPHDGPKVKLIIRDRITAFVGGKYLPPKKRALDAAFDTKSGYLDSIKLCEKSLSHITTKEDLSQKKYLIALHQPFQKIFLKK